MAWPPLQVPIIEGQDEDCDVDLHVVHLDQIHSVRSDKGKSLNGWCFIGIFQEYLGVDSF